MQIILNYFIYGLSQINNINLKSTCIPITTELSKIFAKIIPLRRRIIFCIYVPLWCLNYNNVWL